MRVEPNARIEGTAETGGQDQADTLAAAGNGGPDGDQTELMLEQSGPHLLAETGPLPETRGEKVAALRSAIEKGTYRVSPEETTDAILSEMQARGSAIPSHLEARKKSGT